MRLSTVSTLLTLTLLLGATACSGNTSDNDAHEGAQPDDDCNIPACVLRLYNLTVSCTPTGACVSQATESGLNECFSDGRRLNISVSESNASIHFVNADGSICLIQEAVFDAQGNGSIVLKDASGATLGTGTTGPEGLSSITCDGTTYQAVEFYCPSMDDEDDGDDTDCTPGACP